MNLGSYEHAVMVTGDTVATNDIVDSWSVRASSCRDSELLCSVVVVWLLKAHLGGERGMGEHSLQGILLQVVLEQCSH